jgi:hypothetical protein
MYKFLFTFILNTLKLDTNIDLISSSCAGRKIAGRKIVRFNMLAFEASTAEK